MRRIIANSLFALAIGSALILPMAGTPGNIVLLVLVSVVICAFVANLMLIKSTGLVSLGGISLAHQQLGGSNQAAGFLMILIAVLMISGVVLMIFVDFPNPSKRSHSDEISEP